MDFTAAAHRYWSHRSFKAKLPLRIILLLCHLTAVQVNTQLCWVRDHRIHHKYVDTDADPYNSNRGFFFFHVGWLMVKKHPEVIKKDQQIYISDIKADSLVICLLIMPDNKPHLANNLMRLKEIIVAIYLNDRHIKPTNNVMVSIVSFGEGSHNYHHMFPWDYKASEFGTHTYNFPAMFIDFFAKIGWTYDL
ncbi:acyl-CoA Delta(11) desaturase-like [Harpegnathos saltator]|uniref:acyl-CoA Delta(11) desaturase-like n=1 Tax=Harpegnathos saltator TaxID=610380 RepID=UPI000DBEE62A|nr:acyl-CoA Delta(11) desaturase-like [Harpegnathos saltator]